MKSVTKNLLDEATVKRIAQHQFPGARVREVKELGGGMFNAAYLLSGSGMPEEGLVLKVGPASGTKTLTYEKDIMKTEVEVYGLLEGRDISTPKVYAADFSGEVIPGDYFFMQRLPGQTWHDAKKHIPAADKRTLMHSFGRCNAAVHSVPGEWFGYVKREERFQFDSWGAAFTAMVGDILADGRADSIKLPYEAIEAALRKHRSLLDEVKAPSLVGFDMWPGNVFVAPQNGRYAITGVVDFERAFYGDTYADFTSAVMLFDDVEQEPDFIAGYEEVAGQKLTITHNDRTRMDWYRLYMAVIMCVETYRYGKAYAFAVQSYCRGKIKKLLAKL